ncbi:MAG: precorrin-6A reductase [Eubacterium sp.]|nr:precorrin-6A reductase [Eubacterium sp.]
MYQYLLFAGTTEGRQIAEFLKTQSIPACVFTATEYGGALIESSGTLDVVTGRLDRDQMQELFRKHPESTVLDATHPYATAVSENLRAAAESAGIVYRRILREEETETWRNCPDIQIVPTVADAVAFLAGTTGPVFLTTGSKNLKDFAALPDFRERVYARILSIPASMQLAAEVGLAGEHLMCMQGPFSKEMNEACLRQVGAAWMVTKETGTTGGFPEKLDAAAACGCKVLVIGRPQEAAGISVAECLAEIAGPDSVPADRKTETAGPDSVPGCCKTETANTDSVLEGREIALIGTGVGGDLTASAAAFLRNSDLIIGAQRIVEEVLSAADLSENTADYLYEYRASVIRDLLETDCTHRQVSILFSGDTGFFSGAAAFSEDIRAGKMRCYPGISSISAFAARAGFSWNQAKIVSIHGRAANVISQVRRNRFVFCLLGKPDDVRRICASLQGFFGDSPHLSLTVGEQMGTAAERITAGTPGDFLAYENDPIAVMLIENKEPDQQRVPGIPDEKFIRGKVPMTKEEIRTLAVSKLRLRCSDIVYDIGAGTGSISIEAARLVPDGMVYAIEQNPEGVELIRRNRKLFGVDNLEIVEGHAPEALSGLPVPDAVLIGGSKGTIRELIRLLYDRNPHVRIVTTAITIETVSAVLDALSAYEDVQHEIVQVSVARAKQVGKTHMMMGQNPIFLISMYR